MSVVKPIAASVITIAALVIGGNAIYQVSGSNSAIQSSKNDYQTNKRTYERYEKQTKALSEAKVEKAMAANQINLDDAKKDATDRVNNAFKTAYGNVDKGKYNDAKKDIKKQLGNSFGNTLANLVNPHDSIPYANSIEECKIGFGKYDTYSHIMPMVITVKYKATESSQNSSYDFWTVNYNAQSKSFSNAKHQSIIPQQQSNQ